MAVVKLKNDKPYTLIQIKALKLYKKYVVKYGVWNAKKRIAKELDCDYRSVHNWIAKWYK